MATIPTKVSLRISDGLKRFQPIIESAKIRDINESDTVVILTGILSEVLGFDKYTEITTEHLIRGTYCDLAITIDGKMRLLIEAKAVGIELKENHVKQAVDYAANKGLDWVILTNGHTWKVFKIHFTKPIQNELVAEIDILKLNHKNLDHIELIYLLSKEGIMKSSLEDFHIQKQATNRFLVGNLLLTENVLNTLKKELKQIYPDIKVQIEEIKSVLSAEVIKRELLDGEDANEAKRKIAKAEKKKEKVNKIVTIPPLPSIAESLEKSEASQ
jgi:predicted type IV restriction endonuclease